MDKKTICLSLAICLILACTIIIVRGVSQIYRYKHIQEDGLVSASQSITISGLDVAFSPKGGCEQKVIDFINAENKEILVQAYSFTNKDIADALIAKGKIVHVLVDRTETSESTIKYLQQNGIDVLVDTKHPIAHNKVIITPGAVETGSYNYTNQAENNAENCLFINYGPLAKKYRDNWMQHKAHSISPDAVVRH